MSLGIGPVSQLMTRAMYAFLETRKGWFDILKLTEQAKSEINFWVTGLSEFSASQSGTALQLLE